MKKRRLKNGSFSPGKLAYVLFALLWFFITLFPLYFTFVSSLKTDSEIWGTMFQLPRDPQWGNFRKVLETTDILRAIGNSVFLSLGSVSVMMLCVIMSSYVLARKLVKRANAIKMYLTAALMIPLQGAVVPIAQMVGAVGGKNNYFVLMIIYVGLNISTASFLMIGYISGISREIDEAAELDGCSLFQTVFRIILPMSLPAVATASIVGFLNVYNELAIANVVLTRSENLTVSSALLTFKGDYQVDLHLIFASIVIVIIPILTFYLLCQEKVEAGLAAGSVKG